MKQNCSFSPSLIIQSKSHLAGLNKERGPVESGPMQGSQRNEIVAWQGRETGYIRTEEKRVFTEANGSHVSQWNEKHKKGEAGANPAVLQWKWFQSIPVYTNKCVCGGVGGCVSTSVH